MTVPDVLLDSRTRRHRDIRHLTVDEIWADELPARLAEHGRLAADGSTQLGLPPMGFEVAGVTNTLVVDNGIMRIESGDDRAGAVLALEPADFSRYVQGQTSAMGLAVRGRARMAIGHFDAAIAYEPVMRALTDGRSVYKPGAVRLRDRDGAPLELGRTFTHGDDLAEVAHFLGQAGFLHIGGAFAEDEMADVAADLDRAVQTVGPDGAWWAMTADGTRQAVRILDFQEQSPTLQRLLDDERLTWLADLAGLGHVAGGGAEGLTKPLDVVEGISDLPWHKDCSLGGHSFSCSGLTVGISLTPSDRDSGALMVVPGSHRANVRPNELDPLLDLEPLLLDTSTGDLTVHCSCTLHKSRRPRARTRQVVYTSFRLPLLPGDELPEVDDAQRRAARADLDRAGERVQREYTRG